MISVIIDGCKYPFSRAVLASSLRGIGLTKDQIYDMIEEVLLELKKGEIEEVDSVCLLEMISNKLHKHRFYREERYYRIRRQIVRLGKPVIILIGGATGMGKNAIAAEIAKCLGIGHVLNTDAIRDIMRYMLPVNIFPALHVSSFMANDKVHTPMEKDNLICGFSQQSNLICEGTGVYIKQKVKDGLNSVISGVHLVPGYLNMNLSESEALLFHYVLHIENEEKHKQQFYLRSESGQRKPEYFIDNINSIRKIQEHIKEMSVKEGVRIIENHDFDSSVKTILNDIIITLETDTILSIHKPIPHYSNHYTNGVQMVAEK